MSKSLLLTELGDLGIHPQVATWKVRVLDMWSKPFAPQEKAGSPLSMVRLYARSGVYNKSVSQLFLSIWYLEFI